MASQTLMFVLLPNGVSTTGALRFSIYMAPRLDKGATLHDFPDILGWPALVKSKGLTFHFASGSRTAVAKADASVLRPDIWSNIFTPTAYVEKYSVPDFDKRVIVSYPVRDAHTFVKYAYQSVGTSGQEPARLFEKLFGPLSFGVGKASTLDSEMAQMRVTLWKEQQQGAAPPPPLPSTNPTAAALHDLATRTSLFHRMPSAAHRKALPKPPHGFDKTLDFHKALTAIGSYPALLRAFGLVFDVEVPKALCPDSPSAGAYLDVALTKVVAGFKWAVTPKFSFPPTAYVAQAARKAFAAAPKTSPGNAATGTYDAGDVVNGFLALTADGFDLVQVDVDGAMLKALAFGDNVMRTQVDDSVPSLRSSGIGLMANGRALALLQAIKANKAFDAALTSNGAWPRPFNAYDLVRGYRIDVWSSLTGQWHSLHRRNGIYHFGPHNEITLGTDDEEGFTELAAAQPADDPTRQNDPVATANHIPQPGTDIYLHERVAAWQGWSLSAPRPGGTLNRSADPAAALAADPTANAAVTPFKMVSSFSATNRSLPELRFGARYRVRVRAVDLAGNGAVLKDQAPAGFVTPETSDAFPYLRFEPVPPPVVVLRKPTLPGAHLERLVIRTYNADPSLDFVATTATDERHLGPPKTSVRMVEQLGMLDDAAGKLRGDAATYAMLVARDEYEIPTTGGVPMEPGPLLDVGYLPDPLARGAALRDLPGAPGDSDGRISGGNLTYATLPDAQPRPGSVTFVDFTGNWPARAPLRMVVAEGEDPPSWAPGARTLSVFLPKAHVATVPLSSYTNEGDLNVLGIWSWLREAFEADLVAAAANSSASSLVPEYADVAALITRLVLEGGHDMITPARTLTLVHAVQQPLGQPSFLQLPVVHQASAPILASALRNLFSPITAWREHGATSAALLGGLQVNGTSSAKVEIHASWVDLVDDVSKPGPTKTTTGHPVETIDLSNLAGGEIPADASNTRTVGVYIPAVDVVWFAAPFDELAGVASPGSVAAPLHRLPDTKHRWVQYQAIATSRFQEYFPEPGLDFTRSSEPLMVDVPSSARPSAPQVLYVLPLFGWEQQETSTMKSTIRLGNALRVYLDRPWYSSGANELLGVLLWPEGATTPDYATREKYKPYFSVWGNDPIWSSGTLNPLPQWGDFTNVAAVGQSLHLEETDQTFDVVGYEVDFDADRGLWFCDITLGNLLAYAPFVRLALARYQPHSIENVELSRVVLADFVQLSPTRSAFLSIDPADTRVARVVVGGLAPSGPNQSVVSISVEQRTKGVESDLGWEPAPSAVAKVIEDSPAPSQPNAVLWSGLVRFAKPPPTDQFRVVIREYEVIPSDSSPGGAQRLVYASIVPYDFPATRLK